MSVNIQPEKLFNYINGELTAPRQNHYIEVCNPATGEVYTQAPNSTLEDLNAACASAKKNQPMWAGLEAQERANWLRKLADGIKKYGDELALAECRDTGKPISIARSLDIPRCSANFEFFADAITQYHTECYPMQNAVNYTLREPLGIVACISPWNLPLYLLTWKIAPALVTGNCVIAKPSEITPNTANVLAQICKEVDFPAGVLSILHGQGSQIGDLITEHPDISAVSFTGGTATGTHISERCAKKLKKVSLELGGKNPAIVFSDCDLDKTVKTIVRSAFANQGQVCLCNSRIYIEDELYPDFREKFISETQKLKIGDPEEITTNFGAITNLAQYDKILSAIEQAKNNKANILLGGNKLYLDGRCSGGSFIEPTIMENLSLDCETNQNEIFGPVVTLNKFSSEEEAVKLANGTKYGLAATVFSNNIGKAHRVAAKIQSGVVWINEWMQRDLRIHFGGMKQSGIGREGGFNSLNFFTETKNIYFNYE